MQTASRRKRSHRNSRLSRRCTTLALATLGINTMARGLTISVTYSSSVTTLPNAATTYEAATNYAAQQLENLITDPITVNITVDANTAGLGESSGVSVVSEGNYSALTSLLSSHATTAVDNIAKANFSATDPTGGGAFWIPTAEARALGKTASATTDGIFTFNSTLAYSFSPTNRAVSGEYDFIGLAQHEMTEIMGRLQGLGNTIVGNPGWLPFDIFRYKAAGSPSVNQTDTGVYFSIDAGTTNLKSFNPPGGGDLQDWLSYAPDSFDAFINPGQETDVTPVDLAAMDVIGYTPVTAARTLNWDGTSNLLNSAHWLNGANLVSNYIGAALVIGSGGTAGYAPTTNDAGSIDFSSTSIEGTSLTITNGNFVLDNTNGISGYAYYLEFDNGSSLAVSGTVTYGANNTPLGSQSTLLLGAGLILGNLSGSTANATLSGGITEVGINGAPDPTIYVGDAGTATLTQSGTAFLSAGALDIAAQPTSKGTYNISGGVLNISGNIYLGGKSNGSGGITTGGIAVFNLTNTSSPVVTASNFLTGSGAKFSMSGGSLTLSGNLSISSGISFSITGGTLTAASTSNASEILQTGGAASLGALTGNGTLNIGNSVGASATLTANGLNQNSAIINPTGLLIIDGGSANSLKSLTISAGGKLDLTNHHLFINYAGSADPITTIAGYLKTGYAGGAWNGAGGIVSTVAAVNSASYGLGYADSADPGNPAALASGQIEIKYTLLGDANLDGVVNGIDFGILAANFNHGVSRWDQGDFNYDNVVNGIDFGALAANFNKGASGAAAGGSALSDPAIVAFAQANGLMADVPEPTASAGLLAFGAAILFRRKRLPKARS